MNKKIKVWIIRLLPVPVIALCLMARFYAAGWLFFPGLFIYLIISFLHFRFHYRTVNPIEHLGWPTLFAITLSHVLFVSAFLLPYDYGDGPGWLTATLLLRGFGPDPIEGTLWKQHFLLMNLFVFVPLFISWYPLKRDEAITL